MLSEIIVLSLKSEQAALSGFIKLAKMMGISAQLITLDPKSSNSNYFGEQRAQGTLVVVTNCNTLDGIMEVNGFAENLTETLFRMGSFLFVFGFSGKSSDGRVLQYLTDGSLTHAEPETDLTAKYRISSNSRGFCQEFTGLSFGPVNLKNDLIFMGQRERGNLIQHILIGDQPFLVEVLRNGTKIFLVGCKVIIDIDEPLIKGKGILAYFSEMVPAMLFIRHVFGKRCWHTKQHYASLIIDDPILQERYGFLNYRELLKTMDLLNFATNIAFIPWNFRRTNHAVAQIFKERPDRFSISFHGCNHTENEFGVKDEEELIRLTKTADRKMSLHEQATGLHCGRIMIFPQGVFSCKAMEILRKGNFLGAINSSPYSVDKDGPILRMRDLLELPLTAYANFPLFLRRYPGEVGEFAVDLFLGKPLFIVEHHNFFKNGLNKAIDFIRQVNALRQDFHWGSPESILRRTHLEKEDESGARHVKFYTRTLQVENESNEAKRYFLSKPETGDIGLINVKKDNMPLNFVIQDGYLLLEINLGGRSKTTIEVEYEDSLPDATRNLRVSRRIKVFGRRRLTELRDNCLSRNDFLLKASQRLKNLLFQGRPTL